MKAQAYEGYLERDYQLPLSGRTITIPERRRVVITVFEELPAQDVAQSDKERIDKKLAMLESLKGVLPPDVNLEAARAERRAKRGLME